MSAALKRLFTGASAGNAQLTAVVAAVLLLLLAVEGATLLHLRSLLTVHAFVGMLLIPVVRVEARNNRLACAPVLLPAADHLQDHASRHFGFDDG